MTERVWLRFAPYWLRHQERCKVGLLWWTCLSVCPLAYLENNTDNFTKILCILTVAVARSSSGGVATRYELPVLWMTSCFHIVAPWRVMCIRRPNEQQLRLQHQLQQVVGFTWGAMSAVHDFPVYYYFLPYLRTCTSWFFSLKSNFFLCRVVVMLRYYIKCDTVPSPFKKVRVTCRVYISIGRLLQSTTL